MRTPNEIPIMVVPVDTSDANESTRLAPSSWVKPTRPSAPGTSSQKAGRKLTCIGGPDGRSEMYAATGLITRAPENADRIGPRTRPPMICAL
jgi:hypothetical protein